VANRKKRGIDMHGLVVLDKPLELSSNHALQRVKRLFNAKKAGHTGTLDPLATGALVICFGRATKIAEHITSMQKCYSVVAKLGQETATGDREGEVTREAEVNAQHLAVVETLIPQFLGDIEQIPPMYSALKKDGVSLYKLARKGQEVERTVRKVHIHEIVLGKCTDQTIEMTVKCSKGTYIRTLVEDMGRALGCYAHVQQLRRVSVGDFGDAHPMLSIEQMESMQQQNKNLESLILPIETAFSHYPSRVLHDALVQMLQQGKGLQLEQDSSPEFVCIFDTQGVFRGLAQLEQGKTVKFNQFFGPPA
jgi:tRNA pseudouridine55 synthase